MAFSGPALQLPNVTESSNSVLVENQPSIVQYIKDEEGHVINNSSTSINDLKRTFGHGYAEHPTSLSDYGWDVNQNAIPSSFNILRKKVTSTSLRRGANFNSHNYDADYHMPYRAPEQIWENISDKKKKAAVLSGKLLNVGWTVGYGHVVTQKEAQAIFDMGGWSEEKAIEVLKSDLRKHRKLVQSWIEGNKKTGNLGLTGTWSGLSDLQQQALTEMHFNTGKSHPRFTEAYVKGDFVEAYREYDRWYGGKTNKQLLEGRSQRGREKFILPLLRQQLINPDSLSSAYHIKLKKAMTDPVWGYELMHANGMVMGHKKWRPAKNPKWRR